MMTLNDLAKIKFLQFQELPLNEPVPDNRLSWEECCAWADPEHPKYSPLYENLKIKALSEARLECN